MKVLSSANISGIMFFDDLQWSEPELNGIMHSVFSNDNAASLIFIGSVRTDSFQDSPSVPDFTDILTRLGVPVTTIHLKGMPEADVNLLVSDSLGVVPRMCKSLTNVIVRKTFGLPFHVQAFLQMLMDQDLVTYCLRTKRLIWDLDRINAVPMPSNIVQLITEKMNSLSDEIRTVLKVASCFGMRVSASILNKLSGNEKFSSLPFAIKLVVQDGFMEFDGLHYKFVHDKVRESAYELIEPGQRDQYHFEIGTALLPSYDNRDEDMLYTIIEQVNFGVPSLVVSPTEITSIAHLNYDAGLASMKW